MATNKPSTDPTSERATVAMDAELVVRLLGALEKLGTAFTLDEINDARTLSLVDRLAGRGNGGPAAGVVDPGRALTARRYEEIRGLLGRVGAARPLRMRRTRAGVEFVDPAPVSAAAVVVESPGDAGSGPVSQRFTIEGGSRPTLKLTSILPQMAIARVEVFAKDDALVAFGPSLPPIHRPDGE
jgi:hypothetical protein